MDKASASEAGHVSSSLTGNILPFNSQKEDSYLLAYGVTIQPCYNLV